MTSLHSPNSSTRSARAGTWTSCARPCSSCCRPFIDLEATEKIGAARYERSDNRSTHRNRSRSRLLSTKAGDVELAIPKLRHGSFFPALLEPRRRIDRALWAVIMEVLRAWRQHPQGRRPGGGPGHRRRVSKSQVSRICAELDGAVTEFGERRLDHIDFPYVFVDATYVKAHDGARVVSKAIIVATDVAADGNREVLGLPWATARTRRSGPRSCALCGPPLYGRQIQGEKPTQ